MSTAHRIVSGMTAFALAGALSGCASSSTAPTSGVYTYPSQGQTPQQQAQDTSDCQTWAQQQLSASRTALILATEPAWALFFSVLLTGQRLGPAQAVGAALVLLAIFGYEAGARIADRKITAST